MISNSMLPYITLASIALFILVARNLERLHSITAALLVTAIPFILNTLITWINHGDGENIFSTILPINYLVVTLQFSVALLLFWIIEYRSNDNLTTYLVLVAIGWPVIFLLIPRLLGAALMVH